MKKRIKYIILLLASIIICTLLGCSITEMVPASGWKIKCVTENGEPVGGVSLQICTSETCMIVKSDDKGVALFDGGEDAKSEYEFHIQMIPSGYEVSGEVPDKITSNNRLVTVTFRRL